MFYRRSLAQSMLFIEYDFYDNVSGGSSWMKVREYLFTIKLTSQLPAAKGSTEKQ